MLLWQPTSSVLNGGGNKNQKLLVAAKEKPRRDRLWVN
jgi:hypothetical protein